MSKTQTFITEIRTKDRTWLERQIAERYATLRTLRFGLGFGTVSARTELRAAKRELAQLWTVLGEKLQSETPAQPSRTAKTAVKEQ